MSDITLDLNTETPVPAKKKAPAANKAPKVTTKSKRRTKAPVAKETARKTPRKAVAAKATTRASKGDSKTATVAKLLLRPNGCTRADILKATEWPSVSVQAMAVASGLKLITDKSERPFRYSAKSK